MANSYKLLTAVFFLLSCALMALWIKITFTLLKTCLLFSNGARSLTFSPLEVRRISLGHFITGPRPQSLFPPPVRRRYLCAYKAPCKALHLSRNHYICRERTTNQTFFMQNEPNFPESQMNVSELLTKNYENKTLGERGKNEPKTNPIKANSKPISPETKPIRTQYEPKQSQFPPPPAGEGCRRGSICYNTNSPSTFMEFHLEYFDARYDNWNT